MARKQTERQQLQVPIEIINVSLCNWSRQGAAHLLAAHRDVLIFQHVGQQIWHRITFTPSHLLHFKGRPLVRRIAFLHQKGTMEALYHISSAQRAPLRALYHGLSTIRAYKRAPLPVFYLSNHGGTEGLG